MGRGAGDLRGRPGAQALVCQGVRLMTPHPVHRRKMLIEDAKLKESA